MNTNLGKTKEKIIYELLLSLNHGNTCYALDRVYYATKQYNELVDQGIIIEETEDTI